MDGSSQEENGFAIRPLAQDDFFWLKQLDVTPLVKERDSIYLLFCAYFAETSFVLESRSGQRVGFLLGFVNPARSAYVHYVFVRGDLRGTGLGRMLMQRFLATARDADAARCVMFTSKQRRFYERLGFVEGNPAYTPPVFEYLSQSKGVAVMTLDLGIR